MNRFALITAVTLLTAIPAHAAPQPNVITPNNPTSNVVVVPQTQTVLEDSSAHNRIGKQTIVTAEVGGIIGAIFGSGVNFGHYLDRNSILQIQGSQGDVDAWFSNHTLEGTLIGANYKRFEGNSFYYRVGADYRRVKVSTNDKPSLFSTDERISGTSESITAALAIGNHWQFKSFTIGCDWIGLNFPISKMTSKYESSDPASSTHAQNKRDWEKVAELTTFQVLRFYLGASF